MLPHYSYDPEATGSGSNADGNGGTAGFGGDGSSAGGATSGGGSSDGGTGGDGDGGDGGDNGDGGTGGIGSGGTTPGDDCDEEGALACVANASRNRLVCSEGQWVAGDSCSSSELCDTQSGDGDCKTVLEECLGREAGDPFCNGADRKVCGPDLVTVTTVECATDDHCTFSTTNTCAECLPNEASCEGQTLLVCNETRTGFDETVCITEPCNEVARACSEDECTVDQRDCQNDVLMVCNEALTAFEPLQNCTELGPDGHCDILNLECDLCQANDATCNGDGRDVCDDEGQSLDFEACDPGSCEGPAGSAICACPSAPSQCDDGEGTYCNGDQVEICELDGENCVVQGTATGCQGSLICAGAFPNAACACPNVTECNSAGEMNGSYCSSGGNLATCSEDAQECQEFEPTTCAVLGTEQCVGSHPNAKCEMAFGDGTTSASTANANAELLYLVPVTLSQSVQLRRLGFLGNSAGQVIMTIYDNSGGNPGALLTATSAATVVNGRNEFNTNATPTLAAGTYWVGIIGQNQVVMQRTGTMGPARFSDLSAGVWPNTLPNPWSGSSITQNTVKLYLIGVP